MPLCVYCDTNYAEQDVTCSGCGQTTCLDSKYPVLLSEISLVDCPVCGRYSVLSRQIRCEGGCDLSGKWTDVGSSASSQEILQNQKVGESRSLARTRFCFSRTGDLVAVSVTQSGGQ